MAPVLFHKVIIYFSFMNCLYIALIDAYIRTLPSTHFFLHVDNYVLRVDKDKLLSSALQGVDGVFDTEENLISNSHFMNEEDVRIFRELCVEQPHTRKFTEESCVNEETDKDASAIFITRVNAPEQGTARPLQKIDYKSINKDECQREVNYSSSDYLKQHIYKSMSRGKKGAPLVPRKNHNHSIISSSNTTDNENCNKVVDGKHDILKERRLFSFEQFSDDYEVSMKMVDAIKGNRFNRSLFTKSKPLKLSPRKPGNFIF